MPAPPGRDEDQPMLQISRPRPASALRVLTVLACAAALAACGGSSGGGYSSGGGSRGGGSSGGGSPFPDDLDDEVPF